MTGPALAVVPSEAGLPLDQHEFGMQKGHSPVADKVACVDFDGTIVPWGPLMGQKTPFPGVPEAMQRLRSAGYSIVILTSRASMTWAVSVKGHGPAAALFSVQQTRYVENTLRSHGIPFDRVTAEKVPAEVYFDDKAIRSVGTLASDIDYFLKEAA